MTDEQFDEICRGALAFEPGAPSASTWSKIRPKRWAWLPTVPETLACGCAGGVALLVLGVQLGRKPPTAVDDNPVVQRAMEGSLSGLQASAAHLPDTASWSEVPPSLAGASGSLKRGALR